ncbi:DUF4365 domain-containing protein (plasmid) [Coraliomargarita sp. W4R53]
MSAMRSPENNAKGTSGQSLVKGQFEELGWGIAPNLEHDLGTDLWLIARDARRFDLGALVGAQVKNWALEFDAPDTHDGQEGWWFADSADHFDYWLSHRVPHIQVFYDKESKVSYWVRIASEAAVSTGKQRKIFVPKSQTVDAAHFEDLIAVATNASTGQTWEGSAWLPGEQIPDGARLRYAMIVPRLIAPHGNSPVNEVSADQAVALLTAFRLWEIDDHLLKTQPLLAESASLASEDPAWKLYGALRAWAVRGDLELLKAAVLDLPAEVRAAHTAMLAAALFEGGDARQAAGIANPTNLHIVPCQMQREPSVVHRVVVVGFVERYLSARARRLGCPSRGPVTRTASTRTKQAQVAYGMTWFSLEGRSMCFCLSTQMRSSATRFFEDGTGMQ